MRYEATIDANTLAMFDKQTGERLDAIALIPGFAADMRALVDMLDPAEAAELARLANLRAAGCLC